MSGETPGRRTQMDRLVKQLVNSGNDLQYAKRKALECAIRADKTAKQPQGEK